MPVLSSTASAAWRIIAVAGAALAVIGWVDVLLVWYPARFGSREWEFGVVAQSLQAMPLGTLGLVLMAAGATARGSRVVVAALTPLVFLILLAVLGASALFSLAALEGWGAVGPEMRQALGMAIVKTSVLAVTYLTFYASLGVILLRRVWRKEPISP